MNIKKCIAVIISLTMTLSFGVVINNKLTNCNLSACAESFDNAAKYGDLSYAKIDKDGDGTNVCIEITDCNKSIKSIDIPSEINGIPVEKIGNEAFNYCENLISVTIPNSIKYIGTYAFGNCSSLKGITIPYGAETIGSGAFARCKNLKNIEIPESVNYIGSYAFRDCTNLESIKIPDGIEKIYMQTFQYCSSLKEIIIPDSVEYISDEAFSNCKNLEKISFSEKVCVGNSVFAYTLWLEKKRNENPLVIINYTLVDGRNCSGDVIIPEGISLISSGAFQDGTDIKSIVIPDGVEIIGSAAFFNCTSLTEITVSAGIKYIRNNAFGGCKNLKKVNYKGTIADWNRIDIGINNDYFVNAMNSDFKEIDDVTQYAYELTPLLNKINEYFFVKTDNPNPTSFRFSDKESIYSIDSNISAENSKFLDIKYENEKILRVNGGYILYSGNTDGGVVTLQENINGDWKDTSVKLTLPTLYDDCDYLIHTYADKNNFFDNMDAVQSGFSSICHYSGSYVRGMIVRTSDYWAMSTSPHIDQTFYIQSPYSRKDNQSLFASSLYPFRYDSLGFPSMMGKISQRLDSTSTYKWSDSSHDTILVTYNGKTQSYGGQGHTEGQGISEDKIIHKFTFDDKDKITIESIDQLLKNYADLEIDNDIPNDDEITWKSVCNTVESGSWVSLIGVNSVFGSANTAYSYLFKKDDNDSYSQDEIGNGGSIYWGGSLGYASDMWVDGRYVDFYERYVPGAVFEDHSESDIMIIDAVIPNLKDYDYEQKYNADTEKYEYVYNNIAIDEIKKNVVYNYDAENRIWKADINDYSTIVSMVEQGSIDKKYLDMIQLTFEEIKEMNIDRNTNIEPEHYYIYDGSDEPGTKFSKSELNVSDIVKLKKYLVHSSNEISEKFDFNSDGHINVFDMVILRRMILEKSK